MIWRLCVFQQRYIYLFQSFEENIFVNNFNTISFRHSEFHPNFIAQIAPVLQQQINIGRPIRALLFYKDSTLLHTFDNGMSSRIMYYAYATNEAELAIDNFIFDELRTYLKSTNTMSDFILDVFLATIHNGFIQPDERVENILSKVNLPAEHDNIERLRNAILSMPHSKLVSIGNMISKNASFGSMLPNMLLMTETNCAQQESLSIKYDSSSSKSKDQTTQAVTPTKYDDDMDEVTSKDDDDDYDEEEEVCGDATVENFHTYSMDVGFEFKNNHYYCSYHGVQLFVVETTITQTLLRILIQKNFVIAYRVIWSKLDAVCVWLYVNEEKSKQFINMKYKRELIQFTRIEHEDVADASLLQYRYDSSMSAGGNLYSAAILKVKLFTIPKDSFNMKNKLVEIYVVVCPQLLQRILLNWHCIAKIVRTVTCPIRKINFLHVILYVDSTSVSEMQLLTDFLPKNGEMCRCAWDEEENTRMYKHAEQLWLTRPCSQIMFHTYFHWIIERINQQLQQRLQTQPDGVNLFQLYDINETDERGRIANLLEHRTFKVAIKNMVTFRFYHSSGSLYPIDTERHELYILTTMKVTRIIYKCVVKNILKLDKFTPKTIVSSKFTFHNTTADDPLTPAVSERAPQYMRNIVNTRNPSQSYSTNVINVCMLMNSYNLCGSEAVENEIKF